MDYFKKSPYSKNLPYWKNQPLPLQNEKFIDSYFPPNINSLLSKNENDEFIDKKHGPKTEHRIKTEEITWMRASDIFKNKKYSLFETYIDIINISQGSLGDCYFLASIFSLAKYPNLIYQLFKTKYLNKEGYFELIFYIDGKFQIVIVDDYLPIKIKTKEICFSKSLNNEIWICILEKAWAKINGGYTNIIKGWMHQVLQAFTGFQSEIFKHKIFNSEILWNKIIEAKNNNFIITCSTGKNVKEFDLVNKHAYSFIDCMEIISKGKKVKLVLIKCTWKNKNWNGDWGHESPLWGEEEKKQINSYNNKDLFFMSFEDFYNIFNLTEICYVLYNSYSKSYYINENNINNGNVFNIYMEEEGYFSISLIRKIWRFNRELVNSYIPSFIFIVSYNPLKENTTNYFFDFDSKNESYEGVSLIKYLKKGYYLVYSYIDIFHSTLIEEENNYIIKFDSSIKFKHKLMPNDSKENNFILLRNILIQIILDKNKDFNLNKKYTSIGNKINENFIGYKLVYNNNNKWIKYIEDISRLENIFILSPYLNKTVNNIFEWFIPPKEINIVIGMRIDSKLPFNFNLNSKEYILENIPQNILSNITKKTIINTSIKKYANNDVYLENQSKSNYYNYIFTSLNESKQNIFPNTIKQLNNIKDKINIKYPKILKLLENLSNDKNYEELYWSMNSNKTFEYIGQTNNNKEREGKGCIIYNNSDHVLIGNFKKGKINGKGFVYNKTFDKKYFEGNFIDGKKNGKGILYFYNGDRYEGNFEDDKRNGKGVYFFNTKNGEQTWEGFFMDGNMEGEGIFTDFNGNKVIVKYNKGKQVIE